MQSYALNDSPCARLCFCNLVPAAALISLILFFGNAFVTYDHNEKISNWEPSISLNEAIKGKATRNVFCESQRKPLGSEPLPEGIISRTSNLEMELLWGPPSSLKQKGHNSSSKKSLLAIPVGIKQKEVVNRIVQKFSSNDFIVMLFHYDGIVDKWRDLSWSDKALHVSAINQTKWWFAKRFLHPDIVADYEYIFLWDEDLDVEHFNARRYVSIVRREELEISQPGLDSSISPVHYPITARGRTGDVHRKVYKFSGGGKCLQNSTGPPCSGWVEMMAPVFSSSAWRCVWHMIQNDLIHAWGLDKKLGYCAQGDRSKNIGVVDSEYIGHLGLPTLGGVDEDTKLSTESESSQKKLSSVSGFSQTKTSSASQRYKDRLGVRYRSNIELEIFKKRWRRAAAEDKCWIDPYPKLTKKENGR